MSKVDPTIVDTMIALRRDLHQHPELSWQETRTSRRIAAELEALGLAPRTKVAGTGILVDIPGQTEGPIVALRADIDALPIQEGTGLPFSSVNDGVMHACAHDGHSSMLVGAAALLVRDAPLPVGVRLIFQPAEETGHGAQAMIEAGALCNVGMIFGGHIDRHYPAGVIAVTEGAVNASSDRFRIEISGTGGHAARPHEAVDAVVVGSLLVMALQTIVSREVDPAHPSVVSIGSFQAGTASNVIAGHAVLVGSIRAQDPEVRQHLHRSLKRIADSVAQLHNARIEVEISSGTPPLVNEEPFVSLARHAAGDAVGYENVVRMKVANMGGEDFAYYLDHVPGCYVRFGGQVAGRESFPAHSSRFDFDEAALPHGAAWLANVARLAAERLAAHLPAKSKPQGAAMP